MEWRIGLPEAHSDCFDPVSLAREPFKFVFETFLSGMFFVLNVDAI